MPCPRKIFRIIGLAIICLAVLAAGCTKIKYSLYEKAMAHERRKAGLVEKTIDADGKSISLLESEAGTDKPNVVLIHGFAANKENWLRFAGYLTDTYHVVAMDLPGHGNSVKDFSLSYDIDDQVVYVNEILNRLGICRFNVVGNSMGGAIAALYAAEYPEQVQSLCLIDSAGIYVYDCDLTRLLAQGKNPLIVSCDEDFYRLMDFALAEKPYIPWPITSVMAEKAVANEKINRKIFSDINGHHAYSFTDEIRKITAPTLILWGADDRLISVNNASVFKELIKNSKTVILKGVGHAPMIEVPEKSAKIYREFLDSLSVPPDETSGLRGRDQP